MAPDEQGIAESERRDKDERLEVQRPGIGIVHGSGRYAMGTRA
jgi:hypothetical protein